MNGIAGGPSLLGAAVISGLDTGILITTFSTDPNVTSYYTITFRRKNGSTR